MAPSDERMETRRELLRLAWAVALLDLFAVAIGALAAPYVGREALWFGVGLAAFVTLVFALLAGGNLAIVWLADRLAARRRDGGA